MKSSEARALSRRPESGVEIAGFPAIVSIALIWPSPGCLDLLREAGDRELSECLGQSADAARPAPRRKPRPRPGSPLELLWPAAASVNIAPPSRSRLPVRTLRTSTIQLARVPNSWVQVPIRP